MKTYDFIIIGAGIVGMTVAYELRQRYPKASIAILDKEAKVGVHASGRNSGVLHSGIYYTNDTLKAKVCATGAAKMMAFAQTHQIPYAKSGKIILATSEHQLPVLDRLMKNARENGINAIKISGDEALKIEPHAALGPAAIYCPDTAVIDSLAALTKLQALLEKQGVCFHFQCQMTGLKQFNQLETRQGLFSFGFLFNCAGAYADTLARYFGLAQDYMLIPFKGIYWKLSSEANSLIHSNIYPVPDVSLPFLGVHLTRVINGDVYVGPTAIPVFGRENYHHVKGLKLKEAFGIGATLARLYMENQNNFRLLAHTELLKYRKSVFLSSAQQLLPSLRAIDLIPTPKSGIRPQLMNIKTKKLEMDYIFQKTDCSVHVLNAISPAFTSSFEFARIIVDQSEACFKK
ncbi:MAG: L-2-hydroxyglutarate oxidase [Gammaproteobacteria bacterium]|nr:L-2-hydroxyglutarate oxidase [Gammaproteobacteria bacterium]